MLAFISSAHHVYRAGGMDIGHIDPQPCKVAHGLVYGVGDIMELKIQENIVPPVLYGLYNIGAFAVKKLHAYFDKGLFLLELAEEIKRILSGGEIAGDDHIMFFHF